MYLYSTVYGYTFQRKIIKRVRKVGFNLTINETYLYFENKTERENER